MSLQVTRAARYSIVCRARTPFAFESLPDDALASVGTGTVPRRAAGGAGFRAAATRCPRRSLRLGGASTACRRRSTNRAARVERPALQCRDGLHWALPHRRLAYGEIRDRLLPRRADRVRARCPAP